MSLPLRASTSWLSGTVAAMIYATAAGILSAVMMAAAKHIGEEIHPFEVSLFRCVFGLAVLLPIVMRTGFARAFSFERIGLNSVRGILHAASTLTFLWSVTLIPLATVTAISFTAPLFATLLAIVILGEKVGIRRWAGLVIGFAGTLIILRPGADALGLGVVLSILSTLFWAAAVIAIKRLAETEDPVSITAWSAVFVGLFSLIPALFVWQWPVGDQWFWLFVVGATGTIVQILIAKALMLADTSLVLPFDFLKLIAVAIIGYVIFAEVPDAGTWIGGAIIIASTAYIAYRERQTGAPRVTGPVTR